MDGKDEENQEGKNVLETVFYCTVGYVMLVWQAADHIFIPFEAVLSQKHIITCHYIYSQVRWQYCVGFFFFKSR